MKILSCLRRQLSIVAHQLPNSFRQLSIVNCQLSILPKLSIVNCQLSIKNGRLKALVRQLSIVNCQLSIVFLSSCAPSLPHDAVPAAEAVTLSPSYADAVLPPNIAPVTFRIEADGDAFLTHFYTAADARGIVVCGADVCPSVKAWHRLLASAAGDSLRTAVYVRRDGRWTAAPVRSNYVAPEPCDDYIAYRLIQPGYVEYEHIRICQRTVADYDQRVLYDNTPFSVSASSGQCVNCHSFRDYNRAGEMQLHLREHLAGTLICRGDDIQKVNLKTDSTLSAGVYPAWHPTQPLIAYSVNSTGQAFHTRDPQKIEVIDYGSDLILYDLDAGTVTPIADAADDYETFPAWSPDGRWLYYTSAHYEQQTSDIDAELNTAYQSLRYNLYRRSFDAATRRFGPAELVYDAAADGLSAAVPRLSPDGRWLLFSVASYGQFHIWHHDAHLALLDLSQWQSTSPLSGNNCQLSIVNSQLSSSPSCVNNCQLSIVNYQLSSSPSCANNCQLSIVNCQLPLPPPASYHSWSSNGRWVLFSSRAIDGSYTRLYISYFSPDGQLHAPLLLPQPSPDYYDRLFYSYNVPEWLVAPVRQSRRALTAAASRPARPATFVQK